MEISKAKERFDKGQIPITTYTDMGIYLWTEKLGLRPAEAYEQYFIKPIVISLLYCGFSKQEALNILEAMGITNPYLVGTPYSKDTIYYLVTNRLWGEDKGKSWNKMRDIFLEPIIENLIRRQLTRHEIAVLLGRSDAWVHRFIGRSWLQKKYYDLSKFFKSNYLGSHEVDDYLD